MHDAGALDCRALQRLSDQWRSLQRFRLPRSSEVQGARRLFVRNAEPRTDSGRDDRVAQLARTVRNCIEVDTHSAGLLALPRPSSDVRLSASRGRAHVLQSRGSFGRPTRSRARRRRTLRPARRSSSMSTSRCSSSTASSIAWPLSTLPASQQRLSSVRRSPRLPLR